MDSLKPLLNLACTQVRIGNGGVLRLDFGNLVEYDHPKLKGIFHGIWQVRSHSGTWRISDDHGLIAGDYDDEPVVKAAIGRLANRLLIKIEVSDRSSDTRLHFSGPFQVEFLEASAKASNWEAAGPAVQIFVGPGPVPTVSKLDETGPGLTPDEEQLDIHTAECADRWQPALPSHAVAERNCGRCAYYTPLRGIWYFWDYGLCTNPSSPFDGRVTNEERGCPAYAPELELPGAI